MAYDEILEPARAYGESYKDEILNNAEAYFSEITEKSEVDVEANRDTVKKIRAEESAIAKLEKKIKKFKGLRIFLRVIYIIAFIVAFFSFCMLLKKVFKPFVAVMIISLIVGILMIVLIKAVINKKIKNVNVEKQKHVDAMNKYKSEAWTQMAPLNALYESNITKRLVEQTLPLIKLDDNFNVKRYDKLRENYGYTEVGNERSSTLDVLSGEIQGNPFIVDREYVCTMGTQTYTGSVTIHWTTTHRNSKGQIETQHHTQTLTASVTKPKPFYSKQTKLIYGNGAGDRLSFTHSPTHAESKSEKELEKKVKKGTKKIQKLQTKAMKDVNNNFTELGNKEFDVLFNAYDRDHEIQFRLLFTVLAQKNLLDLMKNKFSDGYGDDFTFRKDKCINYVISEHTSSIDLDTSYIRYANYDYDDAHKYFIDYNTSYFKALYFDLAPLLSIPLYQQYEPADYIYKDEYETNYTRYEAEHLLNKSRATFEPENAETPSILKAQFMAKDGKTDKMCVNAYSYKTQKHVETFTKLGGDGRMHTIPVEWIEYIPIEKQTDVQMKELGLTDKEYEEKSKNNELLEKYGSRVFSHGLFLALLNSGAVSFESDLNNIVKK